MNKRFLVLSILILIAAITRIIPHPYNFAPIGAISLFGAAYFTDKKWMFIIPLLAMWFSDLLVNNIVYAAYYDSFMLFTPAFWWIYGSIAVIVAVGYFLLKKVTPGRIIAGSLSASVIFFLLTNFGAWIGNPMYPQSLEGLLMSYTAAIPFFHNTVLGDLFYCGALFGAFEFAKSRFPQLQLSHAS